MYSINGKFLTRPINGQVRVAIETIKELDKIVDDGQFEIVAPYTEYQIESLNHIPVIRFGKGNPHIWEQTAFFYYLKKNKRIAINILNSHPLFASDICYIHDVLFNAYPNLYTSFYGRLAKRWTLLLLTMAAKNAKEIVTVSDFSKREIIKYYKISDDKIHVIYNGWQHMNSVTEDENIFKRFSEIKPYEYIMAASGITPQKNFKWIIDNAKYNPDEKYVIVGSVEKTTEMVNSNSSNVIYTGRLADGEMKALMKYCKVFIHPAVYEGFGMTPIEAIASGAKNIVVSYASCLPEIYGDCVYYLDPVKASVKIIDILSEQIKSSEIILDKYSWADAAFKLKNEVCKV